MSFKGPRVRDFTDQERSLDLVVEATEVYETLIGLYVFADAATEKMEYDDENLIERLSGRLNEDLVDEIRGLSPSWAIWLSLIGVAWERKLHTVPDFVSYLRQVDPIDFRRFVLRNSGIQADKGHDEATIAAAIAGDPDTLETLVEKHFLGLRTLLLMEPAESRDRVASIVEGFHAEAMVDELATTLSILERDATQKRSLASTMPVDQLVEAATHGVTFELQPNISGILLIPTVVLRPWAVIAEHGTMRIFCYSVDDEQLEADPTAPPTYLVELYKALGDERRLRLLAELAKGDADLRSLSDVVDLAKSTTHHHLRALRSAGLVRVVVSDHDKRYSLRKEGLSEAGPLLEGFLSSVRTETTETEPGDN